MYIYLFFIVILIVLNGFMIIRYCNLYKEKKSLKDEKIEMKKSYTGAVHTIAKLENSVNIYQKERNIYQNEKNIYQNEKNEYESEITKLQRQILILKNQKPTVIDNSVIYLEKIREKTAKINSLEKRIEVLKNKNFYKVSFEKAEEEIEELKNKNRILERNLEAKRKELIRLKGLK